MEWNWWVVGIAVGAVLFLVVMASAILDQRRSRGNDFEERITKKDHER